MLRSLRGRANTTAKETSIRVGLPVLKVCLSALVFKRVRLPEVVTPEQPVDKSVTRFIRMI